MAINNDPGWWARKFGAGREQEPSQQPVARVPEAPAPTQWNGQVQNRQPQGNQWDRQYDQNYGVGPDGKPRVTKENIAQVISQGLWSGGQGKRNSATCPSCGSPFYFRRRVGHREAAPLCSSCGYNDGLFEQALPH